MKHVLIPSDFSRQSIELVSLVVNQFPGEKISIILFHAFDIPDSEAHIMRYASERRLAGLVNEEFRRACRRVSVTHANIREVNIRCFYGNTSFVFQNFLEANKIDIIVFPDGYSPKMLSPNSIDPAGLIYKSGLPVIREFAMITPQTERKTQKKKTILIS